MNRVIEEGITRIHERAVLPRLLAENHGPDGWCECRRDRQNSTFTDLVWDGFAAVCS